MAAPLYESAIFMVRLRFLMRNRDHRSDTSAGAPPAFQRRTSRFHNFDKVIENAIGYVLVENSLVSELLQIEFQALKLDTL